MSLEQIHPELTGEVWEAELLRELQRIQYH